MADHLPAKCPLDLGYKKSMALSQSRFGRKKNRLSSGVSNHFATCGTPQSIWTPHGHGPLQFPVHGVQIGPETKPQNQQK